MYSFLLESKKKLVFELDEKYQEAVMLRYIEELQPQEIAEIVDASVNTISVRIHRGLKKLRNLIEENE